MSHWKTGAIIALGFLLYLWVCFRILLWAEGKAVVREAEKIAEGKE